jgi:hypothetical protein
MNGTYLLCANGDNLVNGEVRICSNKLVLDYFCRRGDPIVVPVGVMKVLEFVSGM